MKIKKGDNVVIISGKDKGKDGKVIKVFPCDDKLIVEGANVKKRHQKPRKSNQKGQIIEYSAPIHVSNTMIVDPKTNKPTRINFKVEGGKKVRIAQKSGTPL